MNNSYIASTGSYLPENIVANEDLAQFPPSAAQVIASKTGILSRRVASKGQCTSDLAFKAATNCLEKIDFPPKDLDVIIVSTSSPDRMQPATSTRVQQYLGAEKAFAFDINSVCSGSTYGIFLADAIIKSGKFNNILLVAAEMYSKILNKNDFSTFPYFGDGAGAILFTPGIGRGGVFHSILRTDGSGNDVIQVPAGGTMLPFNSMKNRNDIFFKMNGKKVYAFAVERGTEIIFQLLEETGFQTEDISCFISHQANINIIRAIAENIMVADDSFFINVHEYGNTASASVLIALDEALNSKVIKRGDLAITLSFGGGLSWGANLIAL